VFTGQGTIVGWLIPIGAVGCSAVAIGNKAVRGGTRAIAWVGLLSTIAGVLVVAANHLGVFPVGGPPATAHPVISEAAEQPAGAEPAQLAQAAGTLAYLLKQQYATYGGWPSVMTATSNG